MSADGYLLVSHGSRYPGAKTALALLGQRVREKSAINVATACLEFATLPLHITIAQWAREHQRLQVLPLFLLEGVHVQEDIPREVALAQQTVDNGVQIELKPYLGSHPKIKNLLAKQFQELDGDGQILLSHGSRRPLANKKIARLAHELGAIPAYNSYGISLERQIKALAGAGKEKIAILPYFLFAGGTIFTLALEVQRLQGVFPQVQLLLGNWDALRKRYAFGVPLETNPELVDLIIDVFI